MINEPAASKRSAVRPTGRFSTAIVCSVVACLAAPSCGSGKDGPAVAVLLDATRSTLDPQSPDAGTPVGNIRADYIRGFQRVIDNCASERCVMVVMGVSNSPSTGPTPRTFDFGSIPEDFEGSDEDWTLFESAEAKDAGETILDDNTGEGDLEEDAPGECTELIGAFQEAGESLRGYDRTESRLVAFTDGISSCDPDLVDVVRSSSWSGPEQLIDSLTNQGRLPRLEEVVVWMPGFARVREGRPPFPELDVQRIRQFWQALVTAGGGKVAQGGFAATLGAYPEETS